jgi:electron transport complex protein RnfD
MSDVLLALTPCTLITYFAYGEIPFFVLFVAVLSACAAEFVFASLFLNKKNTVKDGSAIVTAILLTFTLAPFTPWYVVAFGSAMAVIFGKLLWGGVGRNMFNPALVGREFMTVFFPAVMTSGGIWYNKEFLNISELSFFRLVSENGLMNYLDTLLFKPSGAIGEYSVLFLILGGVYLLLRRRISWHIPFGLLVSFFVLLQLFTYSNIKFSLGGVILGTIYMATDMPSSASTKEGKLYYGAMIAVMAMICLLNGVKHEYMSYPILLANGFVKPVNFIFRPRVWGTKRDLFKLVKLAVLVTLAMIVTTFAIVYLHHQQCIQYLIYIYILFLIYRFCFVTMKDE